MWRNIEPVAKTLCLLPARLLMKAIPLLLRRMACGVQGQAVLAAELPSSPEIGCPLFAGPSHCEANYTNTAHVFFALGYLRGVVPERTSFR